MKRNAIHFLILGILLASCSGPTDKEIGQSVLLVVPTAFIISIGFQDLFFRLWKRKWPDLTMLWLPNSVFFVTLVILAFLLGHLNGFVYQTTLMLFGSSYLTILFIVTRIWLAFDPSKAFTWAAVLTMLLFAIPIFPMILGLTQGTGFFGGFVFPLWVLPGSGLFSSGGNFEYPGLLPGLIFIALIVEVLIKTRKKNNTAS